MIKQIGFGTSANGPFTPIEDFLADGLEPGVEEPQVTEMGDGTQEQDGVITRGEFKATGTALPTPGTRTWFEFTDHDGTKKIVGGADGCRVVLAKTSLRPVGGGKPYTLVRFSCAGGAPGSTIEDA